LCYSIYDHLAKHGAAGRATEAEELAADPRFRGAAEGVATDKSNPVDDGEH
jgi:hypothetical protein